MDVVDRWTGQYACALQLALRMSQDEFAASLGVHKRTVANWHEKPDADIRPEIQRALDTVFDQASEQVKIRFARQLKARDSADLAASGVALTVAIAIVVNEAEALIVCRRDQDPSGITWQFPAGIVKPGSLAEVVAVRETLAETGIHCVVRERLGERVHPLSGVNCEYFLCEYLTGTVENRDAFENLDAVWVPRGDVVRFIPADRIYPPVLGALEGAS